MFSVVLVAAKLYILAQYVRQQNVVLVFGQIAYHVPHQHFVLLVPEAHSKTKILHSTLRYYQIFGIWENQVAITGSGKKYQML